MKKWGVLVIMALSTFIIVIDTTIMNVSISALVEDLNTTVGGIQSAIALYALVMASFMLIGGKLADIFGKKRVFIAGVAVFGLGTSIASFSNSLTTLLVGWSVIEGLGSALMMPNIQTILRGEYDGTDRATAYGAVSAVAAAGAALGPIAGGFLTTYASWRWAFRLEVLIVIIVLALSGRIAADALPAQRPRFDFVGALLSVFGWSAIVLGILLGQTYGFWRAKQPFVAGSFELAPFGLSIVPFLVGAGILIIMLLFRWEHSKERSGGAGLFRPSLLRLNGLVTGFSIRFLHMAIMAAFLFIVPLLFQLTFEYTAMQTGLALMPYSLGVLIFALLGARLSTRHSPKRIIQVGLATGIAGLVILALTVQPGATPADIATGFVFGVGMGLVASQILNLILSTGSADQSAEIAGLNGTFEQLGNSIGVALVGTVMLVSLSGGLQARIEASPLIPSDQKATAAAAVEQGIELLSDSQMQAGLAEAGVTPENQALVLEAYGVERTSAFSAGIVLLVFAALAALILTPGLPEPQALATTAGDHAGTVSGPVRKAAPRPGLATPSRERRPPKR